MPKCDAFSHTNGILKCGLCVNHLDLQKYCKGTSHGYKLCTLSLLYFPHLYISLRSHCGCNSEACSSPSTKNRILVSIHKDHVQAGKHFLIFWFFLAFSFPFALQPVLPINDQSVFWSLKMSTGLRNWKFKHLQS